MPFSSGTFTRTDGTRSGSDVFVQQKNSAIPVTASLLDNEANDMATGLSTCLLKDGTQTLSANLPMNGFKLTGLGAGSARTDSATVGNIQDGTTNIVNAAGGTANALTITLSPAITAYTLGMRILFGTVTVNTGATTVNVNGVGVVNILKRTGVAAGSLTALTGGEITNDGGLSEIVYNGTGFTLMNPASGWYDWVPTHGGFSANPSVVARYKIEAKTCTAVYYPHAAGTSNASSYSVTAPVAAKVITNMFWKVPLVNAFDNSAALTSGNPYCELQQGSSTFTLFASNSGGLWTSSGTKRAAFTIVYEIA
jgi:hypothetical protein